MKKITFIALAFLSIKTLCAQTDTLKDAILREVIVKSTWANELTPITFKNLKKKDLQQNDFGQDMPYLLQFTPSVVVSSDAGTGIGYTGIRIRGTDPTRINVTINGIPYNDAESQGVYWVNINDIFGSTESIQIQRGVGTSANGVGAFGASINLNTSHLHEKAFAEGILTAGSFNTFRQSVRFSSGVLKKHFYIDGRLSNAFSDGYVDRATAKLRSGDLGLTYLLPKASLRFNAILGKEITYQAWNGLPIQLLKTNRTFNTSGTEKADVPYENQVDNYTQNHFQLIYNQSFSTKWSSSLALHLTKGFGYYEEYKSNASFENYGLQNVISNKDTFTSTDLTRRRWLDNWYYGAVYGLKYEGKKLNVTIGGAYNNYKGKHFGEVIWTAIPNPAMPKDYRWYENEAEKSDFNTYAKANYLLSQKLSVYSDLQVRYLNYSFLGKDRNAKDLFQTVNLTFFNPKVGLNYSINQHLSSYLNFGVAHREPNRNDFVNSSIDSRPSAERLNNVEFGLKSNHKKLYFGANLYYMGYDNELVLTGKINDVGEFTRVNVPKSYRAGIELEANYKVSSTINLNGNVTLSQNKIKTFTEYIDDWDTGAQIAVNHNNTDLSFSPRVISAANLTYKIWERNHKKLALTWSFKSVGKQYLDNTSDELAKLSAYSQQDVRLNFLSEKMKFGEFDFGLQCNNIFNNNVISNGWTYRYKAGFDATKDDVYSVKGNGSDVYNQIGLFPQAFRHFMLSCRVVFRGKS